LRQIDRARLQKLLVTIRVELLGSPHGEVLRGEFEGLYKLRVGDYRIIYTKVGDDFLVLRIRHRSKAYS